MGQAVKLIANEQELYNNLKKYHEKLWAIIKHEDERLSLKDIQKLYNDMAETAHKLHMSLENRGIYVKHHKYMIENRGCTPDRTEFYEHIHPVGDLLDFIEDENANDDPADVTIDVKFTMKVYTRRWRHYDSYSITRTANGWYMQFLTHSGECNKACAPVLFKCLEHDGVCYPKQLGDFFEWLWEKAAEDGLSKEQVQEEINNLAAWVSTCEEKAPRGIFKGLI